VVQGSAELVEGAVVVSLKVAGGGEARGVGDVVENGAEGGVLGCGAFAGDSDTAVEGGDKGVEIELQLH
jgi:hypothetical protein